MIHIHPQRSKLQQVKQYKNQLLANYTKQQPLVIIDLAEYYKFNTENSEIQKTTSDSEILKFKIGEKETTNQKKSRNQITES